MASEPKRLRVGKQLQENPNSWTPFYVAEIYAGLRDKTGTYVSLQKAYEGRFPFLWRVRVMPQFDRFCSDPEYVVLLRRMNLAP
ncbi:MAG TPA: hypothetical protein VFV34_27050 [Blastocatellia bacterium]|nr:hypothetical protein [Blastocatellia bacterium]